MRPRRQPRSKNTGWDHLASWYDGWVGPAGSEHHRALAIPIVLELLELQPGEDLLDLGCGQGALVPAVTSTGAHYTGLDVSARMLTSARRRHGARARFVSGDATRLATDGKLSGGSFDAATFLLSIQNMDPLDSALAAAGWALKPGGRLVILMTHPCFRVPRQSGWGWDVRRKLSYRRVDRYLGRLAVPLKPLPGKAPVISFHRPLEDYFGALSAAGFAVDALKEIAADETAPAVVRGARNPEIPLFLALRARLTKQSG